MNTKKIIFALLIIVVLAAALAWQRFVKNDRPPTGGVISTSNNAEGGNFGE